MKYKGNCFVDQIYHVMKYKVDCFVGQSANVIQTWCMGATLLTSLFPSEAAVFSTQAWDAAAALGTAQMHIKQFPSWPRDHFPLSVDQRCWIRISPTMPKAGYLRQDTSSPWFSATFSIPDFTPKEAF